MRKKIWILFLLAITILLLVLWTVFKSDNKTPGSRSRKTMTVTLTPDGFTPDKLIVKKGMEVKFVTTRGQFFWPASDVHPTHELYKEFDPTEPVDPQKSWSFVFDKPGVWKYHDHISPYFTGVIQVTE